MNNDMYEVKVPQMGEGLRFAKVVRLLKNPGDLVEEDDDVVEVETEKAILAISSPVAGIVSGVECRVGDMADVGSVLLTIGAQPTKAAPLIFPEQQRKGARKGVGLPRPAAKTLPARQLDLIRHMKASQEIIVPASIEMRLDWEAVDAIKRGARANGGLVPSGTAILCWAAAQAMQKFDKFRARLSRENELEISLPSLIGIAVAAEEDALETRVVSFDPADDLRTAQEKVACAIEKTAEGTPYHSLAVSDMSSFHVLRAQPVVVYPAVATLFIGSPHMAPDAKGVPAKNANLVLAFDHRVMNGVYAARFLKHLIDSLRRQAGGISTANEKAEANEKPIA